MKKSKEVTITKESSPLSEHMSEDITDAEIFVATREFQDSATKSGVVISNLSQVYHWAIEQRDLLKAGYHG